MKQFTVSKRGKTLFKNYTDRTLTLDTVNKFAFLSEKDKPENLAKHKLRLTQVTLWPYYDTEIMKAKEKHSSQEARLTIGVEGLVEPVNEEDKENLADLGRTPKMQVASKVPTRLTAKRPMHLIRVKDVETLEALVATIEGMNAHADTAGNNNDGTEAQVEGGEAQVEGETQGQGQPEGAESPNAGGHRSATHVANEETLGDDFRVSIKGTVAETRD